MTDVCAAGQAGVASVASFFFLPTVTPPIKEKKVMLRLESGRSKLSK